MKRLIVAACLAVTVSMLLAAGALAASGKSGKQPSTMSKTLQQIDTGTKKLVRGTVDLITLKPLLGKKKGNGLPLPEKPWENNRRKKQQEKKPSFWANLFKPKEEPKRVETMKDFVGLPRPS